MVTRRQEPEGWRLSVAGFVAQVPCTLDYDFGVSIAYKMMIVEPWNMSTEHKLPRHVSRLKTWSKRRKSTPKLRTSGCGNRLVFLIDVHYHVFRIIGDIGYVSDNISDNI